jgi:hypothetical protein
MTLSGLKGATVVRIAINNLVGLHVSLGLRRSRFSDNVAGQEFPPEKDQPFPSQWESASCFFQITVQSAIVAWDTYDTNEHLLSGGQRNGCGTGRR